MATERNRGLKCFDTRVCFAKYSGRCTLLNSTYKENGKCKFCKPDRLMTNGKRYKEVAR